MVIEEQEVWPVPHKYHSFDTLTALLPASVLKECEDYVAEMHARCERLADEKENPTYAPW